MTDRLNPLPIDGRFVCGYSVFTARAQCGAETVLRIQGRAISKLGAYDRHLTNVDAYADPGLAGWVYVQLERKPERR